MCHYENNFVIFHNNCNLHIDLVKYIKILVSSLYHSVPLGNLLGCFLTSNDIVKPQDADKLICHKLPN